MKNKKIYLLDRNVISLIKDCNNLKRQNDKKKINMLNRLRKIDRSTSFISPMISIIEGQTGSAESTDKMKKTIEVEALVLEKFFRKAKIDSDFLNNYKNNISKIFPDSDNKYKKKYDLFLQETITLLIDKPKPEKKLEVRNKIIEIAKKHDVSLGSPVFFCCISSLYGYRPAKKILKPKRSNYKSHNARSDLMVISLLNSIKEAGVRTNLIGNIIKIEFLTMDIPLQEFLSGITIINTKSTYDGIKSTISYSKNMFPEMSDNEYYNLNEDIK